MELKQKPLDKLIDKFKLKMSVSYTPLWQDVDGRKSLISMCCHILIKKRRLVLLDYNCDKLMSDEEIIELILPIIREWQLDKLNIS